MDRHIPDVQFVNDCLIWICNGRPFILAPSFGICCLEVQYHRSLAIDSNSLSINPRCLIKPDSIELDDLQPHDVDVVFVATGVNPSPVIKESGLPVGPDGGLLVNKYLQCVEHPEIFGGGDCIYFQDQPLDKVGVYAVRENPVLLHNLMASLDGGELHQFDPGGDYLLIFNLGDDTGIFRKKCLLFGGKLAFFIKDYIDRKFMKEFQSIEG